MRVVILLLCSLFACRTFRRVEANGAPAGLRFSDNPAVYMQAETIAQNEATVGGEVTTFTVSPALPRGLVLSPTTGAITGQPKSAVRRTLYTVTATNALGSDTAVLDLTVVDSAPMGLSYSQQPALFVRGEVIAVRGVMAIDPNTLAQRF